MTPGIYSMNNLHLNKNKNYCNHFGPDVQHLHAI